MAQQTSTQEDDTPAAWAFRPYQKADFVNCTDCYYKQGENMEKVQPCVSKTLENDDAHITFFFKTGRKGTARLSDNCLFVLVSKTVAA